MNRSVFTLPLALGLVLASACSKSENNAPPPAPSTSPSTASSGPGVVLMGGATGASTTTGNGSASLRETDTFTTSKGPLTVTPVHHAFVIFGWQGKTIMVDPWSPAYLPKADVVFLTDIHPDHLDDESLAKVKSDKTIVVGPQAVADKTKVSTVMKNGDTTTVDGIGVEAIAMYNLERGPAPGQKYHDKGRGNGYVLTFGDKRVYVSGDTECTPEMKALKNIDAAFVCMNLPYTETVQEAAECTLAFAPKVVFPYHFMQKDPSLPPQKPEDFQKLVQAKNKQIDVRIRTWY
ncbi:MAG TPA: MBL fold metallo-hydrolase [Polyangiaceae bacterium]